MDEGLLVRIRSFVVLGCHSTSPAQDGADACDDFAGRKRFGHIIIAAEFETEDAVEFAIAGGEEKHRDRRDFAQAATNFEARHVRQADVKNGEVEISTARSGEGIGAREGVRHGETLGFQSINQRVGDGGLVFNQQNMGHGGYFNRTPGNANPESG